MKNLMKRNCVENIKVENKNIILILCEKIAQKRSEAARSSYFVFVLFFQPRKLTRCRLTKKKRNIVKVDYYLTSLIRNFDGRLVGL